ncbi:MAG: phosphatase PAP2 family protein [Chloroflexi bacterium]|nr:MAG: phosphatase PAP2 family protein [Chloroflexota bacterium]
MLHMRAPAQLDAGRRPDDGLLPPLPAIIPRLVGIAVLSVIFVALTIAIAAGAFTSLDLEVAQGMHDAWQPSLHGLFQVIAELGGFELTTVLMLALSYYLWRSGFGSDALVFIAFIAAQAFELFYKFNLHHPRPPAGLAESDGPSITEAFSGSGVGNSFPSGHMLRTVIAYGLLAFVIRRLSISPVVRGAAVVGAIVVVVLIAFDRLYLDVHWESDVIGGLILGAIALLAGTVWLDRPRKPEN